MKSSCPPVNIFELAAWFVKRAEFETFDIEGAQHFVEGFIACGAHKEAATFVRRLLPAPILFAECAITLMETLCEYQYAGIARSILPWFERRMKSKLHNLKPCDLYIAITEYSTHQLDVLAARDAILAEKDPDERALRLIGTADRLPDKDEHLTWVRTHIQSRRQSDPRIAYTIAYPLVGITHHEADFAQLCSITQELVHHVSKDEYLSSVARLQEIGQLMSKPAIQRVIKQEWPVPIEQQLEQILAGRQDAPAGVIRH